MRGWMFGAMGLGLTLVWSAGAGPAAPAPEAAPATPTGPRDCGAPAPPIEPRGDDPVGQALRHYMRGRVLMSFQEPVLAAKEFRQAAALMPDAHRIWLNLGLTLYDSGNVSGAIESLEKALQLDPKDPATLYFRARIAASQGQLGAAIDLLGRLTTSAKKGAPYHILGTYYLARASQESGDIGGAIAAYELLLDVVAQPKDFFQRYPELLLIFRSQLQLKEMLGRLLLQHGDYDKAIKAFKEILAERPNLAELMTLVGVAYLQKKDYPAAREWAKKVIETQPDGAAGYQRLAEVYKAEGKADAVIPDLEQYRQDRPDNRILAFQLASAYEAAGRKDDAAAIYRQISAEPDKSPGASVAAALKLAEIHIQEGKVVDALDDLASTLVGELAESAVLVRAAQLIDSLKNPQEVYAQAQRLVADDKPNYGPFVLVGMLAEVCRRPDEAVALYDKAITRQPKAAIAYSRKADILIAANRLDNALAVYRAAGAAGLDLPVFHRKMGMILEQLGRLDEALAEYRRTRQAAPDDKAGRYLLAGILLKRGQFEEAEKELKDLLARFPNEVQALCQLAAVALARGDVEAAERAVGQARTLDPAAVNPKAFLAEIRFRQKRFDEAEKLARDILTAHPDDNEVRLLLVYTLSGKKQFQEAITHLRALLTVAPENIGWRYLLSGLYTEMGDPASAEKELQLILQKKPDHAPSNNDLGYLWADRGVNLARAEELIRQALKSEPQSPAYLDSLGWVMYKRGRLEDAARTLEEATRLAPDLDATLWEHLGDAYWQLRRRDDAAKAWQTAAQVLKARGSEAKADDVQRVNQKVEKLQAGAAPPVAPLAVPEPGQTGESKAPTNP